MDKCPKEEMLFEKYFSKSYSSKKLMPNEKHFSNIASLQNLKPEPSFDLFWRKTYKILFLNLRHFQNVFPPTPTEMCRKLYEIKEVLF